MNYSFIGLGNMASAILRGMVGSKEFTNDTIYGYDCIESKALALKDELGISLCGSAEDTAAQTDVLILAVKPQMMAELLTAIAPKLRTDTLVISIAAGKTLDFYSEALGYNRAVIRVMPNICATVDSSVSAICASDSVSAKQAELASRIFSTVGSVYHIPESQFSAFSALGGASGAFILLYIDALSSAGVRAGLPRALAQEIACKTVLGTAKLADESGEHPIALADKICSPGGTTIEGVHTLKRLGFESAVIQGIAAIIEKDEKLGKS